MRSPKDPSGAGAILEGHLEVKKTARYAQLGAQSSQVQELWVVCHGYRQLATRFMRRFLGLQAPHRLIVAPEGLNRFYIDPASGRHGAESRIGAAWMTRADRDSEIRDYVRYLDRLAELMLDGCPPSTRVVGFGFSQGVHTAARWASMGKTRVNDLILWGAYIPPDLNMEGLKAADSNLHLVYGAEDPTRDAGLEASQDERLLAAGMEATRHDYLGGHRVDTDLLQRVGSALGGAS